MKMLKKMMKSSWTPWSVGGLLAAGMILICARNILLGTDSRRVTISSQIEKDVAQISADTFKMLKLLEYEKKAMEKIAEDENTVITRIDGVATQMDKQTSIRGTGDCVETQTTPSFFVCIHDIKDDLYISKDLKETGHFDRDVEETIKRISDQLDRTQDEKVFFEVGGNIGVFALYAAKLGFEVHTIEPLIRNLERLMDSVHLNGFKNIKVYPGAVSDSIGRVDLYAWKGNVGSTFIPTGKDDNRLIDTGVLYQGSALSFKLNDILKDFKRIDIMKIDCEGHEEHVIRGMDTILRAGIVQHVIVEIQPGVLQDSRAISELFKEAGYSVMHLNTKNSDPLTYEELATVLSNAKYGSAVDLLFTLSNVRGFRST